MSTYAVCYNPMDRKVRLTVKILEEPLYDYVLFDLETTGLDTVNDQIVEISALKVAGGKIVDEYSTLVNPGIHIPYQASCINGITDEMVKGAPTVEEAIRGFNLFAGNEVHTRILIMPDLHRGEGLPRAP